jgi:hypothetical protein
MTNNGEGKQGRGLRTEAVSSKISDASDVTFNETDRSLDFSFAHKYHMSVCKKRESFRATP